MHATVRWAVAGAVAVLILAGALSVRAAQQHDQIDRSDAAIRYDQPATDPVAMLLRRPDAVAALTPDGPSGHLRALLRVLDVPVSSQILVFSKGSVQSRLIEAGNPRALYFNDSVVVGWVRGGFIEIAAQDPRQGTVLYSARPDREHRLAIVRSDECLSCHHSARTAGVAGLIEPMGHSRPFDRRWGGWYVTGKAVAPEHFGNVDVAALAASGGNAIGTPRLSSLERTFDTRGYLSPYSDVVALMVFEHQMQMTNLLTRLGWETRVAQREGRLDARGAAIATIVADTADYMLFVDEAPLPSPMQGSSGFADEFVRSGPRDTHGRSLRQLDLSTRLLRYPCSYTIYSPQFEALPQAAKVALYQRLWTILSGSDRGPRYAHLSPTDRRAIVEILIATKPDLPVYFRAADVRP